MFWSGFILISLVPVNSGVLQGTELDQTLCIWSWSWNWSVFFIPLYFIFVHFYLISDRKPRWEEKMSLKDGKLRKFACSRLRRSASQSDGRTSRSLQVLTSPVFAIWNFKPFWFYSCSVVITPSHTLQDSVKMGRGSVTFSNMVDMMGTSGEEGETEDCDERVPLLCPASRFIYWVLIKNMIDIIWILMILMIFSSVNVNTRTIFLGNFDSHSHTDWF